MKKIEINLNMYLRIFFCFTVFVFTQCTKKNVQLEAILDVYIDHYKITKSDHYILLNENDWTDTSSIIVIRFNYFVKDKLNLPDTAFKSSYKGINLYFEQLKDDFPISNTLNFEKIITNQKDVILNNNDYFNDIQIVCSKRSKCILYVLNETNNDIKEIVKAFKQKGLTCN